MSKPSGVRLLCLAVMLVAAPACLLEEERPRVDIVVGSEATELERLAGSELASMLERLFEVSAGVGPVVGEESRAAILVGRPQTNPLLAEAAGESWPDLSDQGLFLRSANGPVPTLLVGGGSPVAVLWAAYGLAERLGVRYLLNRDVYPARRRWSGLPDLDLVLEPNLRIRCWRMVNDLPHGPVSWSLEEYHRFLRQIAKMKYNRIRCALWPAQPFVHYSFRGMEKPPGVLYFGHRHPIGPETIGRERFGSMQVFTNPEFVGAQSGEEMVRRAIGLVRGILKEAKRLGMETGLSIQPFQWPKEFMKVLPGSEMERQLGDLTAGPGRGQSMQDRGLRDMVTTIFRAFVETYPDIDHVHVGMPEHRSWVGQAARAYRRLTARYPAADLDSYNRLRKRLINHWFRPRTDC